MSMVDFVSTSPGQFKVSGRLTRDSVVPLWEQRNMLCSSSGDLQIDLTELEHCDSAGLAFLFALYACQRCRKTGFQFTNASQQLMELVQLSDLDEVLPISAAASTPPVNNGQ